MSLVSDVRSSEVHERTKCAGESYERARSFFLRSTEMPVVPHDGLSTACWLGLKSYLDQSTSKPHLELTSPKLKLAH